MIYYRKNEIIKSFYSFIFESEDFKTTWDPNWRNSPEWKRLEALGFTEITTDRQRLGDTIMIKSDRIPYFYPSGIVLQKSGYIRDYGVKSGFIKRSMPSLKSMFEYIEAQIQKELNRIQMNPGLTERQSIFLAQCTKAKCRFNQTSNTIDVDGSVSINSANMNLEELGSFKFGKIKGNFEVNLESLKGLGLTSLKDIGPSYVGGDLTIYGSGVIFDTDGFPPEIKGGVSIWTMGITSLSSLPEKLKYLNTRYFLANPWNSKAAIIVLAKGSVSLKLDPEGNPVFIHDLVKDSWDTEQLAKGLDAHKEASRLAETFFSLDKGLDKLIYYLKKNIGDLVLLEEINPKLLDKIIKKMGIKRDIIKTLKSLKSGYITKE